MLEKLESEEKALTELLFPNLKKYWKKLEKNLERVKEDAAQEPVHDLRVSIRRLRALVTVFQEFVPGIKNAAFLKEMRRIMKPFGGLRDLHIQHNLLSSSIEEGSTVLSPYIHSLDARIGEMEDALEKKVAAFKISSTRDLMKKILNIGQILFPGKKKYLKMQANNHSCPVTRNLLQKYLMDCFGYFPLVRKEEKKGDFHQLRICVKKLRYHLEILKSLIDEEGPCIEIDFFRNLQDAMGDAHDRDVVSRSVREFFNRYDPSVLEREEYGKWNQSLEKERKELYRTSLGLLEQMEKFDFFPTAPLKIENPVPQEHHQPIPVIYPPS